MAKRKQRDLSLEELVRQFVRVAKRIEKATGGEIRLRLSLKSGSRLLPLRTGIDFLGYVVYPYHTVVRRRVVRHARARLDAWASAHVRPGSICATPEDIERLRSVCASYAGHFSHANSHRLRRGFGQRYPWLREIFPPKEAR